MQLVGDKGVAFNLKFKSVPKIRLSDELILDKWYDVA